MNSKISEVKHDKDKNNKDKMKFTLVDIIFTTLFTVAFIIQLILMLFFANKMRIVILAYIGWITWIFSLYFGLITFRTFKKRGKVPKSKSYINTTILVDKGAYAIIRHPQYLGGILFSISITLWTQIWLSLVLSIVIIVLTYHWTYTEEKNLIEKFGVDYINYKKKVPRLNPILGIIKYIKRKNK
jgi:protein-S-isoprenylcysteine O-methyltransferase Ste14